ncbi:hypothetical protein PMIN06_006098 [Paraphaeosphaeria minitans]
MVASWLYRGGDIDDSEYSEIDLFEAVNKATASTTSFYTGANCSVVALRGHLEDGSKLWCLHDDAVNEGCRFNGPANSFAKAANEAGYRYVVLLLETDAIKVWYFKDEDTPGDFKSGQPDPGGWKQELSVWLAPGGCDFARQFGRFHIVSVLTPRYFATAYVGLEVALTRRVPRSATSLSAAPGQSWVGRLRRSVDGGSRASWEFKGDVLCAEFA